MFQKTVHGIAKRGSANAVCFLALIAHIASSSLQAQTLATVATFGSVSETARDGHTSPHKPVIAIIGDSSGVELTDFLVPHATLSESGVAQVITVAARNGRFALKPSTMTIDPDMTFALFDASFPNGADYVIVPALQASESAAVRAWIKAQAAKGATIVSICEGARVTAGAGLLDGRRATTHWRVISELEKHYSHTTWVRNARYVVDDHRISTTGVSASLPVSLFLIERIAGRDAADSAARRLGVTSWDARHDTGAFHLSTWMFLKAATNYFAWWRHDVVAVPVIDGVDEVSLALTMDAIPRTMRAKALSYSEAGGSVVGRQGLRIWIDRSRATLETSARMFALPAHESPTSAFDSAIAQLGKWYGNSARELILLGMEFPTHVKR